MSYLFQRHIEPAIKVESTRGNATYLKGLCESETASLIDSHGRDLNIHDDLQYAEDLVRTMGDQFKPKSVNTDWAGNYVSEWRMVSSNAGIIRGMVSRELHRAYQIGLDIRSSQVIGAMFNLAVQVWSTLGEYSSPTQDEGRR
ncbi:hypothetical protein HP532_03295 [Pseudomonas sp. CrR25]|nr:hypothetical protein [Pseudomonas sp. CrR25]